MFYKIFFIFFLQRRSGRYASQLINSLLNGVNYRQSNLISFTLPDFLIILDWNSCAKLLRDSEFKIFTTFLDGCSVLNTLDVNAKLSILFLIKKLSFRAALKLSFSLI
jgi:hypothetical protein